jgi:hypothetical protein
MTHQTWPAVAEAPAPPDTMGARLLWCHPSALNMAVLFGVFGGLWPVLWLVSPGMAYRRAVLGVLALPLLIFGTASAVGVWRSWREARLGRTGAASTGEVVRILEGRTGSVLVTQYTVDYRFHDAAGRPVSGRLKSRKPSLWMSYNGAPLTVRYDPAHPGRKKLRNV